MSRSNAIQIRRIYIDPLLAAFVCLFLAGPALAQPEPKIPGVIKHDVTAKRGNLTFRKALADPAMLSTEADQVAFDAYIHSYLLSRLVMVENVKQLPELRDSIKRELKSGPKGAAHARYNFIALNVLKKILAGSYAPVVPQYTAIVRYNALAMIGDLNQEEEVKKGSTIVSRAVPYAPALGDMLKWVGNPNIKDYAKAAVLRGLLRHAEAGVPAAAVGSVQSAMLALFNEKAPPAERSPKVHAWMRRRAADVLGAMKSNGAGDLVAKTLVSVMRNAAEPLLVRGTAAAALGQLPLAQVNGLNAAQLQALKAQMKQILDQTKALGATAATPPATKPAPKP